MKSVLDFQVSGISLTCPWQVVQPTPLFTWMEWLKYT